MQYENLNETVSIKTISETETNGVFEIEGLYSGYGVTIGNAFRRVLLSSLPGAAITQVKMKGAHHEFGTLEGISEDVVEIALNIKRIRFQMFTEEPQVVSLKVKGEGKVFAKDIKTNADVLVVTPDVHIATITNKSTELEMEFTIERGLGYVPVDTRKSEKLPIGVIAVDALFSPVVNVNFSVENMRVGDKTDYNRLRISVVTDGTVSPSEAMQKSASLLEKHFTKISGMEVQEAKPVKQVAEKKTAKKTTKKATKKTK